MNPDSELFKKLVKDAGIQLVHWDDSPRLYIENMTYDGNLAKFAELIVRECISIVDDAERGGSNDVWDNAVKFVRRDLKEHFGIKE
jgi:hypothetical protein